MRLQCRNATTPCELGCGKAFPRSLKDQHSGECQKKTIACSYCTSMVTKDEVEEHQKSVCQEYPVVCDYCYTNLPRRGDVSQKCMYYFILAYCEMTTSVFMVFNTIIYILTLPLVLCLFSTQFQQHVEDDCTEYEMDCPVQQITGCRFKVLTASDVAYVLCLLSIVRYNVHLVVAQYSYLTN